MTAKPQKIRVIKVGGSLLTLADIDARMRNWLAVQPPRKSAIIVGGGELVDAMRAIDRRFQLDPPAMHWRCVELLQYTFQIFAELIPELPRICDSKSLERWTYDLANPSAALTGAALVSVESFYRRTDESSVALPADWSTTTDSIAALLARRLQADELILLKSCTLPVGMPWSEASRQQIVDTAFPQAIRGIDHVSVVDLKS